MLEVFEAGGRRLVELCGDRVTIGKDGANDVVVDGSTVSRFHARLERVGPTWTIEDLDSRNGTLVNSQRVFGPTVLGSGDAIRLGASELIFRGGTPASSEPTAPLVDAPELTSRERDVLIELCRPLVDGDLFYEPASPREIGKALGVSEDAIKKHLVRLYHKFEIPASVERRRVRLANLALTSGAVGIADLRS